MLATASQIRGTIQTFVRGFCAQKSATHPYEFAKIGDVWVMRDAVRKNPRYYRKEEWIAYGTPAAEVDIIARRQTRGRFFVCAVRGMEESDEKLRASYKEIGYRLMATEPLFVHRLKTIPRAASPAVIERVASEDMARRFGKASRSRPIPIEQFGKDAPFRQYVALESEEIVGWVRSIDAGGSNWVANMYVRPKSRRRGIGMALLTKMLRDDKKRGAKQSVLLSSHTGALVYPRVGYEQIGMLYIYAPRKGPARQAGPT
ncbi:MAG TPA: GNAT family N-acetyltransferase [Pirellulaceae bacterium]|jgi:GNAT superfamily N-acetyltransferase